MSTPPNADSGEPDDVGRGDDPRDELDAPESESDAVDDTQGSADAGAGDEPGDGESDSKPDASDSKAASADARPAAARSVRAQGQAKGRPTASRKEAEAARQAEPNVFARIARFVRQVVQELRKVVTPTRNELFTYIGVVIVFLVVMMIYVGVLDFGFGRLVLWAFGG
ncbi:preprotein translocase subunit SecE [Ruania rhizosphaerae]|uniref:preprotein translocase subunit SecE n=1 Tax=Ruania rhizosphaerae TaxID=1840413 RepID=UPI003083F632